MFLNFDFFPVPRARDLLQGWIISYCIVYRVNGMIFGKLLSCSKFLDLYESVKLFRVWNRDTGLISQVLASLLLFFNSRTAIAGAIIGLLLVFSFCRRDFCYDHMTSQPLQIFFLFVHAISTEVSAWRHFS